MSQLANEFNGTSYEEAMARFQALYTQVGRERGREGGREVGR